MSYATPLVASLLGAVTAFYYRDEVFFPTNMRIKVAMLEYHMLTRQKLDMDVVDILDGNNARRMSMKSKEI
jgi:hypothetical protein